MATPRSHTSVEDYLLFTHAVTSLLRLALQFHIFYRACERNPYSF